MQEVPAALDRPDLLAALESIAGDASIAKRGAWLSAGWSVGENARYAIAHLRARPPAT